MRDVADECVHDGNRPVLRGNTDMYVDAENQQASGDPLHAFQDGAVARIGADLLVGIAGDRVGTAAHQGKPARRGQILDETDCHGQVGLGVGDRVADPGDDLDDRLEQLVFGTLFGMFTDLGLILVEDGGRRPAKLTGTTVDQRQLPLDTETGRR